MSFFVEFNHFGIVFWSLVCHIVELRLHSESFFSKTDFGADGLIRSEIDNFKNFGTGFYMVAF